MTTKKLYTSDTHKELVEKYFRGIPKILPLYLNITLDFLEQGCIFFKNNPISTQFQEITKSNLSTTSQKSCIYNHHESHLQKNSRYFSHNKGLKTAQSNQIWLADCLDFPFFLLSSLFFQSHKLSGMLCLSWISVSMACSLSMFQTPFLISRMECVFECGKFFLNTC